MCISDSTKLAGSVLSKLGMLLTCGNDALVDIYGSCIRSLIGELDAASGSEISNALLPQIQAVLSRPSQSTFVAVEASLDVLNEMLVRRLSVKSKLGILSLCDDLLTLIVKADNKASVRKRATLCLGSLIAYLEDDELKSLMVAVSEKLTDSFDQYWVSFVHSAVRSGSSNRLKPFLPTTILPRIVSIIFNPIYFSLDDDRNDDLIDLTVRILGCLLSLAQIEEFLAHADLLRIAHRLHELLRFCPNVISEGEMDEDFYSDDEDSSWKVRRAVGELVGKVLGRPSASLNFWEVKLPYEIRSVFVQVFPLEKLEERVLLEPEETVVVELLGACKAGGIDQEGLDRIGAKLRSKKRFKLVFMQQPVVSIKYSVPHEMRWWSDNEFGAAFRQLEAPGDAEGAVGKKENILRELHALVAGDSLPTLPQLERLLELCSQSLIPKNELLVREVDLGPFKHRVDEGVSVRVAAMQLVCSITEKFVFINPGIHAEVILTEIINCCVACIAADSAADQVVHSATSSLNSISGLRVAFVCSRLEPLVSAILKNLAERKASGPANTYVANMLSLTSAIQLAIERKADREGQLPSSLIKRDFPRLLEIQLKLKAI